MTSRRLRVPVYYDFASTLSYVAHRVLGRLAGRLDDAGIDLVWRPLDLTIITGWRRGAPLADDQRRHVAAIARSLAGDTRVPRTWLDARDAACTALGLANSSREATWRERVWTAIYEQGIDPGTDGTVDAWERELDLAIEHRPGVDTLAAATADARAAGVVAVPTLLLGQWPMAGVQDDETMLALLTRFAARRG